MSQRAESSADVWAERLVLDRAGPARRTARAARRAGGRRHGELSPAFFVRLVQRLGELESGGETINSWLEHRLSAEGIVLETAAAAAQQEQAANQVSIANSITSIRLLDALDWREFFESVSVVEAALRNDPARTYAAMDFESRDRYRHAVEQIARRSEYSEIGSRAGRPGAVRQRPWRPTRPTTCAGTWAGGSSTRAASNSRSTSATARGSASASTAARCCVAAGSSTGAR